MFYYSTNNKSIKADFKQATIEGQPADKGLYFPEYIPQLSKDLIGNIKQLSKEEIAFEVIKPYVGDTIDDTSLKQIIAETVFFDFPLVRINDNIQTLELFHGPTLAFKDVGARFLSRCLGYFSKDSNKKTTVLVATSGDTGGAVANSFYEAVNVDVVILYPSGKVSNIQELQLTTLDKNITALEVEGSFDDCQQMVKDAFADKELNAAINLTSANSINVARWLPQQFYYFYAYQQWNEEQLPVITVPSGNFGNICAGLLAFCSGLPVKHFIAACNENDVASHYLVTGEYLPQVSVPTLSNAMDVGDPSNFVRILELFGHNHRLLREVLNSYCISDELTIETIQNVKNKYDYLLDPHGAVGYASLKMYQELHKESKGYFLETAHPVKFDVESIIGEKVELPETVKGLLTKTKKSIAMKADATELKDFLLSR
jgi:threonine synthase